jgi:hypothetical protein
MLSRRIVTALDGALLGIALRPFQEQLLTLAAAELADCISISSHEIRL